MTNNFDREFNINKIPYKVIIKANSDFIKELKAQYKQAPEKPSFELYLAQFCNENEINKGFDKARKTYIFQSNFEIKVNNHYQEFIKLQSKGELSNRFYCPDIEKTPIYKALTSIKKEIEILQKSVFNEKTDQYKEAEIRANNINSFLNDLQPFTELIKTEIKTNKRNPYLFIKDADNKQIEIWQVIKSNFNSHLKPALPQHLSESENTTAERLPKLPENEFDDISIKEVYDHFKVHLVDRKRLTEQELIEYLKAAFEQSTPPEKRFIIKKGTKEQIRKIFYNYYKDIAGKPYGKQEEYAALLGKYFKGYNTDNVSSNFSK